jgi:hypothetical protein
MSSAGLLGVTAIASEQLVSAARAECHRRCRPFGVADAMIATAFIAGGFALGREVERHTVEASAGKATYLKALQNLDRDLTWAYPVLACLTLGWLVMRLRRPRPRLALMARQPGMAAMLAVGVILAPAVVAAVFVAGWGNPDRWVTPLVAAWPKVGPAVAMIWLALFVTGRRRSERGWVDGSGRILGILWIATVFLKAPIGPWYPLDPKIAAERASQAAEMQEFFSGPAIAVPAGPPVPPPSPVAVP